MGFSVLTIRVPGGLVQLLAGMWEFACGNTFGATALSSFGGFWISFAIIFTPGGFAIEDAYGVGSNSVMLDDSGRAEFFTVFSFYLFVRTLPAISSRFFPVRALTVNARAGSSLLHFWSLRASNPQWRSSSCSSPSTWPSSACRLGTTTLPQRVLTTI